jgi:hypothetical protein
MPQALEEIITKERGIDFVDVCGDVNPIHREGNIVQGLQLASFLLKHSSPQPQYSSYKLKRVEIRFKDIAEYNEPLFFSSIAKQANESTLEIAGQGAKKDGKSFIEMEIIFSKDLEVKPVQEVASKDLLYNKTITSQDIERYCRSINIDYDLFKINYLRRFFVSTFVTGALCTMLDPRKLPQGKRAVFAKQEFDFYDMPEYNFDNISMTLKKIKDTEGVTKINENCYTDKHNIMKGSSLILKVNI